MLFRTIANLYLNNMNTLFISLCVLAVAVANSSFRLPENEVSKLKQVHDACQANKKTYCDEDLLRNLVNNQNDAQVGIHMLCMAEKAGLMEHDGSLNVDTIKDKISLGAKPGASVDSLVTQCARSKNSAGSTAVQLWICFVQNDIHYYHRL